jgi:CBS domain-containing protein
MATATKTLLRLTAGDLMSRELKVLPQEMSLREAARRLSEARVSGAPVVDSAGRCVGVLSCADFVRSVATDSNGDGTRPVRPRACPFWVYVRGADGQVRVVCTLAPGVCALQGRAKVPGRRDVVLCTQPYAVCTDWQGVEFEALPAEEVRAHMTAEPVTVGPETPIGTLADVMLGSHIHRVIVTDAGLRPIGIVSSTDILSALAHRAGATRRRKQRAVQGG